MTHMYAVDWPWPAARGATSHPLTPLPHRDRQGEKIWWKSLKVEIKRGRLLTSYCHRQYRLDLGKISFIANGIIFDFFFFFEKQNQALNHAFSPHPFPGFTPSFPISLQGDGGCGGSITAPLHRSFLMAFPWLNHRPLHGLKACALPWSPSFSSSFSDFVLCPVVSIFSPLLCLFSVFALS